MITYTCSQLSRLYCSTCHEETLHARRACIHCKTELPSRLGKPTLRIGRGGRGITVKARLRGVAAAARVRQTVGFQTSLTVNSTASSEPPRGDTSGASIQL